MKTRAGLQESLEEYAARLGLPPHRVRVTWRLQGLRKLFPRQLAGTTWEDLVPIVDSPTAQGCRVAPGVRVPTFERAE